MEDRGLARYLESQLKQRDINYSQMARQLGVSHATIHRWLTGSDIPDAASCGKLAEWSGEPLHYILYIAGHTDVPLDRNGNDLPGFRRYLTMKYAGVFPDELVTVLEGMISQYHAKRRAKQEKKDAKQATQKTRTREVEPIKG